MPLQSSESCGIVEHYMDITTVAKAPACNHLHFYNTTLYFKAALTFWTRLVNPESLSNGDFRFCKSAWIMAAVT